MPNPTTPDREPLDWQHARRTLRRRHDAVPAATFTQIQNAVQVALDTISNAIDASERHPEMEYLRHRARGAVEVLKGIASQVTTS